MGAKKTEPAAILIRPATTDDSPLLMKAIIGLAAHVGEADGIACTEDDIRRFGFGEKPAFEAVIAEIDGAFAGMCLFFPIFSTWYGRPGVFVQDLFVDQQFRSFGIGERLLRHVARLCRDRGGVYIRLAVDEDNARAHPFYTRLGFAWTKDQRSYIAGGPTFQALSQTTGEPE
ncbi:MULTISPECIES: GNAT family N-acetyltransferase [Aminobacter]|jgi:GNAT superfamily N-acetyltransferase|uniref:GNAT superfamily N-acetyltransferase n=2 Tax=Aminobacter ciceronei TaxID=150723 RepID=A0ABR6C6K8_9HYPH|nr:MULTISPECIES: GNAT family N-acetyltransferase [Aminobacter]MBA8906348.1 GNAT superfamily N-acetyltransferase [Aminobacter ciceronei]MBA9020127.1 GNAT superfamily N-acetyltransferase [Aminobacter ciceronei]QOF69286.1 GNAT family N-acetyltransferase [Aminobacter sp. SR38]